MRRLQYLPVAARVIALIIWVWVMRYIDHILQPGEKLAYSTKIHWIIYLPPAIMWLMALVAWATSTQMRSRGMELGGLIVALVCAVAGSISLFAAWFRRWTTEIDVTDRRVVYKRGFIRRHTVEMNMDKIESVDVDQSILGRLLGYGDIVVRGTGTGMEPLRNIDAPLEFRNCVTAR